MTITPELLRELKNECFEKQSIAREGLVKLAEEVIPAECADTETVIPVGRAMRLICRNGDEVQSILATLLYNDYTENKAQWFAYNQLYTALIGEL